MSTDPFKATERTRVRRKSERGVYDRATVEAILDEALLCHVATVDEQGRPRAIPTIHVRVGDVVYVHGSTGSRTLRGVKDGQRSVSSPRCSTDWSSRGPRRITR